MRGSKMLYVFLALLFVSGNVFWVSQTSVFASLSDSQTAAVSGVRQIFADNHGQGAYDAPAGSVTSKEPVSANESVSESSGSPSDKASGDCTKAKKDAAQKAGGDALKKYEAKCAAKKGKVTWTDP
ncbi:MAG: hypothetical protein JO019_00255, partial [Candidatus Kaiserbacteria bacterium]|nr:hypothetical protein [Candidatus Kaiserbacteria bacterium]